MAQFRTLGGVIGISIATSISTPYLRIHLADVLPAHTVVSILHRTENIALLPADLREAARVVFGESMNLQIKLVIGLAAAQLPATAIMWTKQVVNTGHGE
jgi:hypothetical protein